MDAGCFPRSCLLVCILLPLLLKAAPEVDICGNGTIRGTFLRIVRPMDNDHTTKNCQCVIDNTDEVRIELNMIFAKSTRACNERFVITWNESSLYERCSQINETFKEINKVAVRARRRGLLLIYSWTEAVERIQFRSLDIIVESSRQKISVSCNQTGKSVTSTPRYTKNVTPEIRLVTKASTIANTGVQPVTVVSSVTSNVSPGPREVTLRKSVITTATSKSRETSQASITHGEVSQDPTSSGMDNKGRSSRESKRNVVATEIVIVVVVLSVTVVAFVIGMVITCCRRRNTVQDIKNKESDDVRGHPGYEDLNLNQTSRESTQHRASIASAPGDTRYMALELSQYETLQ